MGRKDKLIQKLNNHQATWTWQEVKAYVIRQVREKLKQGHLL